jgi:glycosyltransferase involved in cell wall biosynthesis
MRRGSQLSKQEFLWSPDRSKKSNQWHGSIEMKPWQYSCEVVIPVLDTPDILPICIELLRLQHNRPYIVVVDTGSSPENFKKINALAAEDVEVHSIKLNATRHPSDYVAIAMDLAMSLCRTDYMFCTHADCFLTSRNVITELLSRCNKNNPAVGYQLTERAHEDWKEMVSHTCTMLHIPTMDRIGAGWSLRSRAYPKYPWS